ncbi:MAG: sigma-70 family RNA polymerase sigma factor [Kineosporiaceae bacterium]|nr:sigma-70 family RNA polymerase sigma factor [Kineosporiaceae bacterium]
MTAEGERLVRLARGLLRDPAAAEDVVQDVLATALLRWSRVGSANDVSAYVRRMVVNACTSHFRRAVRRERAHDPEVLGRRIDHPGAGGGSAGGFVGGVAGPVADAFTTLDDRDRLVAALRKLPAKQRAVLVLRHFEGLADAEIAAVMNTREVTVRSNAHRGLARLREILGEP